MGYKIKLAKSGSSYSTTDPRNLLLDSDETMLKFHSTTNDSIAITAGNTTGTCTVNHGLSYIPSFIIYAYGSDPFVQQLNDAGAILPVIPDVKSGNPYINAYANSTSVVVKIELPSKYNETTYTGNAALWEDSTASYSIIAGKKVSTGTGSAVRFTNIAIPQGEDIVSAKFEYKNVETTATDDIKFKIYGIDEDNTASFDNYSNVNARDKTTEYNAKTQAASTSTFNFGDTWTDIVQEIVDREDWESGNAMGFVFNDNGSPNDKVIATETSEFDLEDVELKIVRPGTLTIKLRIIIFKDEILV